MKLLIATLLLSSLAHPLFADESKRVDATRLYADYERNVLLADQKYKDKQILVTGTVDQIGRDLFGAPFVRLHAAPMFGVQCNFKPADAEVLAKVKKERHYVITGTVVGKIGNVILRDCSFVAPPAK